MRETFFADLRYDRQGDRKKLQRTTIKKRTDIKAAGTLIGGECRKCFEVLKHDVTFIFSFLHVLEGRIYILIFLAEILL